MRASPCVPASSRARRRAHRHRARPYCPPRSNGRSPASAHPASTAAHSAARPHAARCAQSRGPAVCPFAPNAWRYATGSSGIRGVGRPAPLLTAPGEGGRRGPGAGGAAPWGCRGACCWIDDRRCGRKLVLALAATRATARTLCLPPANRRNQAYHARLPASCGWGHSVSRATPGSRARSASDGSASTPARKA